MTSEHAELVVTGARVRLGAGEWTDAVAVRAGRIAALGHEAAAALTGPRTRRVHAPGGLLLPGFQDAHVHPPFAGRNRLRVSLDGLPDRAAYLDAVAAYAAAHPGAEWITGGGWAMEHFPGGTPHKADLDRIVPDRPVFLFNRDVHGAWANSRALEIAGVTRETPDPSDGRIERDPATGEPTGTLHEGAAYRVDETYVPQPDPAEWRAAVLDAQAHLHALGVTGWQDAWVTPATQAAYQALAADGRLTARVAGALWWDRHRGLEQIDDLLARREQGLAVTAPGAALGRGFHPGTVKIMTDGVLENHTGALLEPYRCLPGDHRGLTYVPYDLLREAVTLLDGHGFQLHLHTIGDRAVREALDAVEAARAAGGPADRRHTLAHVQVVHPDDLPRFAALGAVANCQAYWAQSEPQMDDLTIPFLGPERSAGQYPFAALLASGARLAMGSDWPVTTPDPLAQLEVAVTRTDPARRDTPPFLPGQRLTLDDALDAFTAGSAHVNHDDQAGAIAPGRRADLVLLDTDILAPGFATADRVPVADASVRLTIAAGEVVYDAADRP